MRKKFGLVLGGGGLRGAAHLGFLQALRENGIEPDVIAGSSAGGLAAALYGLQASSEKTITLFKKISESTCQQNLACSFLAARFIRIPEGLIKGKILSRILQSITENKNFSEYPLPIAVTATDLHTGKLIVFTTPRLFPKYAPTSIIFAEEKVHLALRATIAIPGIFTPVKWQGRILADGGIADNVPADILKYMGVEKVAAVDLGFMEKEGEPPENALENIIQTVEIMGQKISDIIISKYADLAIYPKTGKGRLFDFHLIPDFFQSGYREGLAQLKNIRRLLQ